MLGIYFHDLTSKYQRGDVIPLVYDCETKNKIIFSPFFRYDPFDFSQNFRWIVEKCNVIFCNFGPKSKGCELVVSNQ